MHDEIVCSNLGGKYLVGTDGCASVSHEALSLQGTEEVASDHCTWILPQTSTFQKLNSHLVKVPGTTQNKTDCLPAPFLLGRDAHARVPSR
jgi:hypothetical protein